MQCSTLVVALFAVIAVDMVDATTTTHDSSKWWPHWAWWVLALGLLCLVGACVAALMPMCKKEPAKKRAVKKEVAPAPATTAYAAAPVATMSVPMTMAAPSFVAQPTYA